MIDFLIGVLFFVMLLSASHKARLFPPEEREKILATNARKKEEALRSGGWFYRLVYSDGLKTFSKVCGILLLIFLILSVIF